jgi:hypothetical protein
VIRRPGRSREVGTRLDCRLSLFDCSGLDQLRLRKRRVQKAAHSVPTNRVAIRDDDFFADAALLPHRSCKCERIATPVCRQSVLRRCVRKGAPNQRPPPAQHSRARDQNFSTFQCDLSDSRNKTHEMVKGAAHLDGRLRAKHGQQPMAPVTRTSGGTGSQ